MSNPLNSNYVEQPEEAEKPLLPTRSSEREQRKKSIQDKEKPSSRYRLDREERERSREDRTHSCRSRTFKSAISEVYTETGGLRNDKSYRHEPTRRERKGSFTNGIRHVKDQECSAKSNYL